MKLEFNINEYIEKIKQNDFYFHTFINKESLAAGVLVLQPGESDTQEPHESDELYFILKGDGFLKIKNIDHSVSENKMYYVGKNIEHFFYGNSKELVVLYFFGGPDS
jgi:mannose-6-phosphate isomerase-like protein (cupin superfamily)